MASCASLASFCTQAPNDLFCTTVLQDWVVQVNRAEAEFWRLSSGQRVGYSDEILGFDCGGQQLVLEVKGRAAFRH